MNRRIILEIIGTIIIATIAFYSGLSYGKSNARPGRDSQFGLGQMNGQNLGNRSLGMVSGEITDKDENSITVKTKNGSTIIVLLGTSVKVSKSVDGTSNDLTIGTNISITGKTNNDGSITAENVQIRTENGPSVGMPQTGMGTGAPID